ncbi:hypothetical protein M501DRAFT_943083 [Patellaria atrata CBS 101060]|uniref:C2H2-type domain-containing protein n=1 Tax=Patellaria atrata CBS 101060 TaxID=1346257 RepID=A0A9P4VNY0_9PEZI|nr:hypothetical protein M501DRAFT_943083 [Patellaria atrata CBS 101060]
MDGRQTTDFPQSGLHTPYPTLTEPQSEGPSADQASAAQYPQGQDPRTSNFSSSATPTSEYGINPSSARSGSFPDYIRSYNTPSQQSGSAGGMAQATSPSMPLNDGHANKHNAHNVKSDPDLPIDPSIAASPTYPSHQQYSPYPPQQHDMSHYAQHPTTPMYAPRPEWAGGHYPPGQHPMPGHYGHPATSGPPGQAMVSPVQRPPTGGHPLSTVYSFVPIPGAQQHKRPRRRYEEIERMYKCGWNGCEKAYGTLNHLNAHVTMQSHGVKRTPEEFKEIRKEWKAKKKEEEAQRKAEDERQRQQEGRPGPENGGDTSQVYAHGQIRGQVPPPSGISGPAHQLPPIGYAPASATQPPPQYGNQSPAALEGMAQYANGGQMYNGGNNNSYPPSPYGQPNQMYCLTSHDSPSNCSMES